MRFEALFAFGGTRSETIGPGNPADWLVAWNLVACGREMKPTEGGWRFEALWRVDIRSAGILLSRV